MNYVFIVGLGGTGTKLTMNILNSSRSINISDDMHFLAPRWLREDFVRKAEPLGPLDNDRNVDRVVDLMYSGRLEGNFWNEPDGIDRLSPGRLKERILQSDRSYASVLRILVEEDAFSREKDIPGARLPVNIVCVPTLLEWFPDSKIIHLLRDPRAVHMSRVKKDVRDSSVPHILLNLRRLPFTYQQTRATAKIYRRYRERMNYYMMRFEDIVAEPEKSIQALCEFLEVEFLDEMLNPPVDSTAYVDRGDRGIGIDKNAISRWRDHIPGVSKNLLEWTLKREMREMGYLSKQSG